MDVWVTQAGSGQFHNLTHGSMPELVNPSVRTLGFSPDGSLVTFWVRRQHSSSDGNISIWAVPTLGGQPRPYLEGVAESDWSHDGTRLAYHTPEPGTRCSCQTGASGWTRSPSLLRLRTPQSLSIVGARFGLHLLCPGFPPRQIGHLARPAGRRNSGTDHVAQWTRELSGPARSEDANVSRKRCGWLGPWLHSVDIDRRFLTA